MNFEPQKEKPGHLLVNKEIKCQWCENVIVPNEFCWYYQEKNIVTCKKCDVLNQFKVFINGEAIVHNVIVKKEDNHEKQMETFQI
jgi:phage FluMu protein Com